MLNVPRPHYSDKERDCILEELQLGCFAQDEYKCGHCGKSATDLSLCLGCHNSWFCGKECQHIAWKSGHKQSCKKPVVHVLVENKEEALQEIAQVGYVTVLKRRNEPVVIVRDPNTGKLFDSLRNDAAVFSSTGVTKSALIFHTRNRKRCPQVQEEIEFWVTANNAFRKV